MRQLLDTASFVYLQTIAVFNIQTLMFDFVPCSEEVFNTARVAAIFQWTSVTASSPGNCLLYNENGQQLDVQFQAVICRC
jgi:hypothetical protein